MVGVVEAPAKPPATATVDEREVALEGLFICHTRAHDVLSSVHRFHAFAVRTSTDKRLLPVVGPSGSGKSEAVERYWKTEVTRLYGHSAARHVIYVRCPERPTELSLYGAILEQLGDPHFDRGNLTNKKKRLKKRILENGTSLIILDELHHLIMRGKERMPTSSRDMLKLLPSELENVGIVLALTPEAWGRVQQADELLRRTQLVTRIDPFDWDKDADRAEFTLILDEIDAALPFEILSDLALPEVARALHIAGSGILGLSCQIVELAMKLAIKRGLPQLTPFLLAEVCATQRQEYSDPNLNPFAGLLAKKEQRAPFFRSSLMALGV